MSSPRYEMTDISNSMMNSIRNSRVSFSMNPSDTENTTEQRTATQRKKGEGRRSTLGKRAYLLEKTRMSLGGPASQYERKSTVRQSNYNEKNKMLNHKMLLSASETITMIEDIKKKQEVENDLKKVSWFDYITGKDNEKMEEEEKQLFQSMRDTMDLDKKRRKDQEIEETLKSEQEYYNTETGAVIKPIIINGKIIWRRVFKKRYCVPILALAWMVFSSWVWYWHNPEQIPNWSVAFFYTVEIGMGIGFDDPDPKPYTDFLCIYTFFFILIGSLLFSTVAGYFFEYVIQTTASMKEKEKHAFIEKLEGHDANMIESAIDGQLNSIEYDIYFGDGNLDEHDMEELDKIDKKSTIKKDFLLEIDGFSLSVVILVIVFIFLGAWISLTVNPSDPPLTVAQAFLLSISAIQSTGVVQPNIANEWSLFVFSLFCLLGQPVYCLGMAVFATAISLDNSKKMAKRELIMKEKTRQKQFHARLEQVMNHKKQHRIEIVDYATFLELELLRLGIAPEEILAEIKASYGLMVEQHELENENSSTHVEGRDMDVLEQSPYLKSLPNNVKLRFQYVYDKGSPKANDGTP